MDTTPTHRPNLPFQEEDTIDIKRYLSLFLSNWYWFAATLFISLSIAYGINRYSEEIFTVSATLLIKDDQLGGGSGIENLFPGTDLFQSRQNLKNEIGILKSYSLNRRVIDSLPQFHIVYVGIGRRNIAESRMYGTAPFIVIPNDSIPQPVDKRVNIRIESSTGYILELEGENGDPESIAFGERYNKNGFDFVVELRNPDFFIYNPEHSNKYRFWFPAKSDLANSYRSRLSVNPIEEEASLLTLSLSGPVTEQETDYLNMLMKLYIDWGVEVKQSTAASTIKFIKRQMEVVQDSLDSAESRLEGFWNTTGVVDLSREGTLIHSRLEQYENEKTGIRLQLQYYEYLIEYLADRNSTHDLISPSAMGVTDPQLIRLVQELGAMQQQKRQMMLNLREDTGPLELLERSIKQTREALGEIVKGGKETLGSTLEDINIRIDRVDKSLKALPKIEQEYLRIQRDFDLSNTVYTFLLEKEAEAGIAKASTVSDNRIIDPAFPFNSSQIKPQKRRNYSMAFIMGIFIPIGLILLLDFLNNRIIDKRDVEKGTSAPVIGYINHNSLKTELPVHQNPGSTLAESFRAVRTNLGFFTRDLRCPVVAVSSTITSEGKTFVSTNLAAIVSSLGKRVLLIGLDLRKPRIHKILGIDNSMGLSTYLSGGHDFDDVIQPTSIENLYFAPAGVVPPNPAELIETERMKLFLDQAREHFDYVIIDTPPVAVVTDALLLAQIVDMYMLVVRQRYTSKNTLELIDELYRNGTLRTLGIVINDISMNGYYGYGLRYGYYRGYGYSYGYTYYNQKGYGRYGYKNAAEGYYFKDEN